MNHYLRMELKEKQFKQIIQKEKYEENELSLDKSSCEISLTESETNGFEEKYDYQHELDIESLSDESYQLML